jgi:hypothetical protein
VGIGKNQYGQTYNFNQCTYSQPLFERAIFEYTERVLP